MKNNATTNTDFVTITDRAAAGNQPDNTPATGGTTSGGGGGGPPTGAAGGDLAGTYPNPSLAAVGGGAIGPIGDATHVSTVTRDAKGRVTGLTSTAISFPTSLPPSGAAGGGLGGTYPNPSVTPAAGLDTTAIHSGSAAGGDLTGTYPNPTLVGIVGATTKGSATRSPTITIDAKGRVTALTDSAISGAGGFPVYNVATYGATPNSIPSAGANDTAIAAALTAIASEPFGATLYFPQGYWYTSAVISFSSTVNLRIQGEGMMNTMIVQTTGNTGVISVAQSEDKQNCTIQDLCVAHNGTSISTASAIKVVNSTGTSAGAGPNLTAINVNIDPWYTGGGDTGATRSFGIGWELQNLWYVSLINCNLRGNALNGTGMQLNSTGACHVLILSNCTWQGLDKGIEILSESEGLILQSCAMAGLSSGIWVDGSKQLNQLGLVGTHINIDGFSGTRNTIIEGHILQLGISACNFYGRDSTTFIKGNIATGGIAGSVFGPGTSGRTGMTGISIESGHEVTITGNTFAQIGGATNWTLLMNFDASSFSCRATGNTWNKAIPPAAIATDAGTNNIVGETQGKQVSVAIGAALADLAVDVPIDEMGFGRKASSGSCFPSQFFAPTAMVAVYDYANGATTKTNARIHLYMADGTNLPNATRDFNLVLSP